MWIIYRRLCALLLVVLQLSTNVFGTPTKCETCRTIAEEFVKGLDKTAKSSFGGGNTNWEERKLGSFANSETRFLEVFEHVCEDGGKECHHMLEEHEENLEKWFFLHYARGVDQDLEIFLCIDKLKVCCPNGTYGAECATCLGGKERPCSGNGKCEGSGTRKGSGKCVCNAGYNGELCTECSDSYYEESRNETHTVCQACDRACNATCTGAGRTNCDGCQDGWTASDTEGCSDVNECDRDESPCRDGQYCLNNDGSYRCLACDVACNGCTAAGADNCKSCSTRYFQDGNICQKCHASCATSCTDTSPATCDSCASGWRLAEDGETCQDIDECVEGLRSCDDQAYCVNTEGNAYCNSCNAACDGCKGPSASQCILCNSGYVNTPPSNDCLDVDECAGPTPVCLTPSEKCFNTAGLFRCDCAAGFQRRRGKCEPKQKSDGKKKDKTKEKVKPEQPDFSKSPLTKDLGEPVEGSPLDEMVVMQGSMKQTVAPPTAADDSEIPSRVEL